MPENYDGYESWVHHGRTAKDCAFQTIASVTIALFISMLFQIHFYMVAKAFYLELKDPQPEQDGIEMSNVRDWDPAMYANRPAAGQPVGFPNQQPVMAIPVGAPGMQNAQPIMSPPGGMPVMGVPPQPGYSGLPQATPGKKIQYDVNGLPLR